MRVLTAVALAISAALAACGGGSSPAPSPAPTDTSVHVTITVIVGVNDGVGTKCGAANFGTLYYSLPGSAIKVKNESGTLVGVGSVPATGIVVGSPPDDSCKFETDVTLKGPATFYTFDLGDFGQPSFSRDDLEKANWRVDLG